MALPSDKGGASPQVPPRPASQPQPQGQPPAQGPAKAQPQGPAQPPVDSAAAQRDAADLYKAMNGGLTGWGTDEEAIFKTLSNKSPAHIDEVKRQYQAHYKSDLVSDLKGDLGGNDLQRAMNLV